MKLKDIESYLLNTLKIKLEIKTYGAESYVYMQNYDSFADIPSDYREFSVLTLQPIWSDHRLKIEIAPTE